MPDMRCHWEHDDEIGAWFLPGCMGGAVYGPDQCTCDSEDADTQTELVERVTLLEERVRQLEKQ